MALLDEVRKNVSLAPAMEEYDVISSIEEDDDVVLEASIYGESSIIGDSDQENDDEYEYDDDDTDADFVSGDITESEDPDLGEDKDDKDFSFEESIPNDLQSLMNDYDEEEDPDALLDPENETIEDLFDQVIDDVNSDL